MGGGGGGGGVELLLCNERVDGEECGIEFMLLWWKFVTRGDEGEDAVMEKQSTMWKQQID